MTYPLSQRERVRVRENAPANRQAPLHPKSPVLTLALSIIVLVCVCALSTQAVAKESPPALSFGKLKSLEFEPVPAPAKDAAPTLRLRGQDARQQLLVTGRFSSGLVSDYTSKVAYKTAPEGVVAVDTNGFVTALSDGVAKVTARSRAGKAESRFVRSPCRGNLRRCSRVW